MLFGSAPKANVFFGGGGGFGIGIILSSLEFTSLLGTEDFFVAGEFITRFSFAGI